MKRSWYIAGSVLLVLAALAAVLLIPRRESDPVVVCGEHRLSNTELAYYYWSEYFYFSEAYGQYLSGTVDFSKPLAEQSYDADRSWEDYLLEQTLLTIRDSLSMVSAAEQEGFSLPEDYAATYQQVLVNFASAAQSGGYDDLDAYLRASYGRGADRESFSRYLHHSHLAAAYADLLLERCLPSDSDCRAYFSAHSADYAADPAILADDETTWLEQVRRDLQNERYQNQFRAICSGMDFQVNHDGIVLTPPENLYS